MLWSAVAVVVATKNTVKQFLGIFSIDLVLRVLCQVKSGFAPVT